MSSSQSNADRARHKITGLIAVAALFATAACGGDSAGGALGGRGEELTVITSQAPWNPAYEKVVRAFEEETGIKVDLRAFPNDDVSSQIFNDVQRSEEHTSELQSRGHLVCRLLLEK